MEIRIISDIALDRVSVDGLALRLVRYPATGNVFLRVVKYYFLSYRYDYLFLNFSDEIFLFGLLKRMLPFNKCRFLSLDIFLPTSATSLRQKVARWIRSRALKGIHAVFLYSKQNDELCRAYRISSERLVYVPFKINEYDLITRTQPRDGGYIFSGGVSRRDYATLIEAMRGLDYPLKIVTPRREDAIPHGTHAKFDNLPPCVEVVHDDGTIESFVSYIANSSFVVLPLIKEDFASTGTSVYLVCMALKKCVIISEGPASRGILTDGQALMVPPENVDALQEAIRIAIDDQATRQRIARTGHEYAMSLGDEASLYRRLLSKIRADFTS